MTLIAGLNLSDRLYLLADSRVIYEGKKIDNVCKVVPIYGKNVLDMKCLDDNYIALAVAGNLEFACFLHKEIKNAFLENKLSGDIRVLFNSIDGFLKEKIDYWLSNMNKEYDKKCCLLFAGSYAARNKKIDIGKLNSLIKVFQKASARDKKTSIPLVKDGLKSDKNLQLLNKKLKEEAGKSIFDLLEESRIPKIKSSVSQAIKQGNNELLGIPDSLIFSVMITPSNIGSWYRKQSAEWGEFLIYGSGGINKEDASEELLVKLELTEHKNTKEHLIESAILDTEVQSIAKEKGFEKIGGVTLINVIKDNESKIIPCKNGSFFANGQLYINILGNRIPIVSFMRCHEALSENKSEAEL